VRTALQLLETVTETSRKLGPYVLLEVLLPGGTLFALALFIYRHPARARRFAKRARRTATRVLARMRERLAARTAAAKTWTSVMEARCARSDSRLPA
jgi:hypothetical protein